MHLKGLNVLIDGYNLKLRKGAGLKSYGLTLIQALNLLGANVDLLSSRRCNDNPILSEVLFFDANWPLKILNIVCRELPIFWIELPFMPDLLKVIQASSMW